MIIFIIGLAMLKLLAVAFFILLIVRFAAGIKARHGDSALAILQTRFVKGEITQDDFIKRREVLENS